MQEKLENIHVCMYDFQIHLDLQTSGRANNDISKEIMEIVKDLSVSAFRGSQVNINMEDFDGSDVTPFPVFIRRSQIVSMYTKSRILLRSS